MIEGKNLMWNKFSSLKDKPDMLKKLVEADCQWQALLEDLRNREPGAQILVTGIQNSGKSTLCNLLVGDNDNTTFEIGDTEVTYSVKRAKVPETGAIIVDTPGFGTAAAQKTDFERLWQQADILVYVASVLTGSIADNKTVLAGLKEIAKEKGLKGRVCLVCSKMGDSENAREISEANSEIAARIFGSAIPTFLVDSHWHQEAVKADDARLSEASGVKPFCSWLGERLLLPTRREDIFRAGKKKWQDILASAGKAIESSIGNTRKKRQKFRDQLCAIWQDYKADILYEGSALGKFLATLEGIFSSPARIGKIMSDYLYTSCLDLCDMVLEGPEKGINGLREQIGAQQDFLKKIEEVADRFDLVAETGAIATKVANDLSRELRTYLNEAIARAEREKTISLDLEPLIQKIQKQCNGLVSEKITYFVKDLFDSGEFGKIALDTARFSDFQMKRKTERHEYEVPESYYYERSPTGFWENICSLFGKSYTGVGRKMVKKSLEIDLGFDQQETYAEIIGKISETLPGMICQSLSEAKRDTLDYARNKVGESIRILREAESGILAIRGEIEKKFRAGA